MSESLRFPRIRNNKLVVTEYSQLSCIGMQSVSGTEKILEHVVQETNRYHSACLNRMPSRHL